MPEGQTGEEHGRKLWSCRSLKTYKSRKVCARIPHPALRATFPPGEGMTLANVLLVFTRRKAV